MALLEARPEFVDPPETAGLAGAIEQAIGSNGAPVLGPVLLDVPQQHLVFLGRPRPLHAQHGPLPRLSHLRGTNATARCHRCSSPAATATTLMAGCSLFIGFSSQSSQVFGQRARTAPLLRRSWEKRPSGRNGKWFFFPFSLSEKKLGASYFVAAVGLRS